MKTIGILPLPRSMGHQRMLDALGEVFDVRFVERPFGEDRGIDAWYLPEVDQKTIQRTEFSDRPCFVVVNGDEQVECGDFSTIEFSDHPFLPTVLNGRQIRSDDAVSLKALPHWARNCKVLASKEDAPIWVTKKSHGLCHHYVTISVPELNDAEPLLRCFNGKRFLSLLPFLLFLQTLVEDKGWEPPPLQSCFMFDDPNLHWRTYGFINFKGMAEHAHTYNYHASFATIPLDQWFVHRSTAALFKQNSERISLLIHGNNHVDRELNKPLSTSERRLTLQQSLYRIAKLERRSGLKVSRVMAAPHGSCSEDFLGEMSQTGFEAVCISKAGIRYSSNKPKWFNTVGMYPANIVSNLTVLPRFPLSPDYHHNNILVAAILHQPIIPTGHHQDVADGLQLVKEMAKFINSLGVVLWSNTAQISRSLFSKKVDGKVLEIRMFTKRVIISIPEGVNQVWIERPWLEKTRSESFIYQTLSEDPGWKSLPTGEPLNVVSGQKIEIISGYTSTPTEDVTRIGKFQLWPAMRRQLTETRDRIAPLVRSFSAGM